MSFNFTLTRLILIFRLSAILLLSGTAFSQDKPDCNNSTLVSSLAKRDPGTQILPHSVTQNWYSQAVAKIEEREYFIRTLDKPGAFGAVNHPQHLGYLFTEKGYSVTNFNEDGSTKGIWNTHFLFAGIGRKDKIHERHLLNASQTGDMTLQYDYGDYTIMYDNWKQGMEQSFLIKKRPSGKKELQIVIGLNGDLAAGTDADNQLVLYSPGHPEDVKLVYDQLKAWDRNKKSLPARLQVTGPHRLVLTVDDSQAAYPITVDPLNHTPAQTFTGDNVLGSGVVDGTTHVLYGFSLSGAGDVNGDGIDDIVIGSPTFTKLTISGGVLTPQVGVTGAAFVYYGIQSAIPSAIPSKVLQPTGLATGALFGYSVSSTGKTTGGTTSGIVVGAPGDHVILDIGFIITFPTSVPIGKVYVFASSSFTGDVNTLPAPTATLSLGDADFDPTVLHLLAPLVNPYYGFSVSSAGDVDGDGFADIVVGCPYFSTTLFSFAGRADIYRGSLAGLITTPARTILGQRLGELFGFSVSSAGKVQGVAIPDGIIVGAPGFLAAASQLQGQAYVFNGHNPAGITITSDGSADRILPGAASSLATLYGFSVSGAGDVDGDGFADVIVGEPLALEGTFGSLAAAGSAHIYYGSLTGIVTTASTTLRSPRSVAAGGSVTGHHLLFGYSVGNAGNVIGDAGGDVLVGEPGSTALSNTSVIGILLSGLSILGSTTMLSGQAYLFNSTGGTHITTNAAPAWTLNDAGVVSAANLLGASVHTVGDVDNDGIPDFLVGSPSGTLDLALNLTALPTLSTGALGNGLITSTNSGNAYLFFGFSAALPVNFLSFTASAETADVLLNWATAQEENSDHFEIERSSDNSNFASIGQVTAAHNSSLQRNYSFTDESPVSGNNYYRLKEVDLDGQSIYSKVVSVNFGSSPQKMVAVYPNPAHESFQLQFKNMRTGRYEMNLLSPVGQVIQSRSIQVNNPVNYAEIVPLNAGLAQGTYIIRLVDQQQHVFISKVVIR